MTNRAGIPLRFEVFSLNIGTAGRCQPNGVVPSVISRKATDAEMQTKMSAENSVRGRQTRMAPRTAFARQTPYLFDFNSEQ